MPTPYSAPDRECIKKVRKIHRNSYSLKQSEQISSKLAVKQIQAVYFAN